MKGKRPHYKKHRDDFYTRIIKRSRKRRRQAIIRIAVSILVLIISLFLYGGICQKHTAVAFGYDTCTTLWDLADKHCPNGMDKRDFIDEVKRINAMPDYKVYTNRLYQYPVYEN